MALAPVLAFHACLCQLAPAEGAATAAPGRAAAGAELSAWASSMLRVLSLLTEAFAFRVKGLAAGTCAGGPGAGFE